MARAVCVVHHAPDRVAFGWSDGPDSFPTCALTGQTADRFRERLLGGGGVRERLRDLAACLDSSGPAGFDTPDVRQAGSPSRRRGSSCGGSCSARTTTPGRRPATWPRGSRSSTPGTPSRASN